MSPERSTAASSPETRCLYLMTVVPVLRRGWGLIDTALWVYLRPHALRFLGLGPYRLPSPFLPNDRGRSTAQRLVRPVVEISANGVLYDDRDPSERRIACIEELPAAIATPRWERRGTLVSVSACASSHRR